MEENLAVLIDFENIAAGTEKEGLGRFDVEALMQRVKDKGRILVARSYADWGRFSRFKQSLLAANVTMMELTSHGMQDKNRADIAMVVDALELAFTRDYINTFVVVSGDSDFTPMVLKMRELNKRVIGCGTRKSTSRLLINACDEFFFYDAVVAKPKKKMRSSRSVGPAKREGGLDLPAALDLLEATLEGMLREDPDPPLASVVKSAMLRKSPDFSESDLGFSSFARFLEAAQAKNVVRVSRDNKSGGYRLEIQQDGDRPASTGGGSESLAWADPYVPAEARTQVSALAELGLDPLGAPTRKAVLEALEQVVSERTKRRRKVTLQFISDDIKKHLRRTHPDLPSRSIRAVLLGLMQAEQLIHRDGSPIRSQKASFRLTRTADQLNDALTNLDLEQLRSEEADLSNPEALAELFLGDRERVREIEEQLAWLAQQPDDADDAASDDTSGGGRPVTNREAVDLDDLLMVGDSPAPADEEPAPATGEEEPAPAAEDITPTDEVPAAADEATADEEPAQPAGDAVVEEPPKVEEPPAAEAAAEPDPDAEPPKPRKRTRRRPRKKTPEELAAAEAGTEAS